MLKAGIISLGCSKNLVDSELMIGILRDHKINIINEPNKADILIVNTCGFIDSAKEESITTILQMAEYKKSGKCKALIVTGCLAERYKDILLEELPEVSVFLGVGSYHKIIEAINEALLNKRFCIFDNNNQAYNEQINRVRTTPDYSAYVKIADGCDNWCSYCAIPSIRGPFRSRKIESIVKEVKKLVKENVKEINLIAQDTTSYGKDIYGKPNLVSLLKELTQIKGDFFIRLLYCYPKHFSDELIDLIANEPKICKYIDLPLQHIDDKILKKMNRSDRQKDIELLLEKIHSKIPNVVIRTSLIVGFPGETEKNFKNLKEFISKQKFEHVGIFTYSQEENTPAAKLNSQIDAEIKEERYHELMSIQSKISQEINEELAEKKVLLDVIIEAIDISSDDTTKKIVSGRSYREAPDIDGCIYIENWKNDIKIGDTIKVKIIQGFSYDLLGEQL